MAKKNKYKEISFVQIMEDYHSGDPKRVEKAKLDACNALEGFIVERMKKKYPTYIQRDGDDLVQCGRLAVIKALPRYNPAESKPTTFFAFEIDGEMQEWINTACTQATRHYGQMNKKIQRVIRQCEQKGISWNARTIAELADLPLSTVKNTLSIVNGAATFEIDDAIKVDSETGEETGSKSEGFNNPEDEFLAKEKIEVLYECLNTVLTTDEKAVVIALYGINSSRAATLKEIAAIQGVTTTEVKSICRMAFHKLRNSKLAEIVSDRFVENDLFDDLAFFPDEDDSIQTVEYEDFVTTESDSTEPEKRNDKSA